MKDTELKRARDRALYDAYKSALKEREFRNQDEAIAYVCQHASPRFWISPENLAAEISRILQGRPTVARGPHSRRRIAVLYERYQARRMGCPAMPRIAICEILVEEQAPEFYISRDFARQVINRHRFSRIYRLPR